MLILTGSNPGTSYEGVEFAPGGAELAAVDAKGRLSRFPLSGGPEAPIPLGDVPAFPFLYVEVRELLHAAGRLFVGANAGLFAFAAGWEKHGPFRPDWSVTRLAVSADGGRFAAAGHPGHADHSHLARLAVGALPPAGAPGAHETPTVGEPCVGLGFVAPDRFACLESPWGYHLRPAVLTLRDAGGAVLQTRPVPMARVGGMAASPTGGRLAVFGAARLLVFDGADLAAPPVSVRGRTAKHFTAAAFHPSGRLFAAASNDAGVALYDAVSGSERRRYEWELGRMRSVAFSPDGALAAAGGDAGKIVVWDVEA